MGWFSKRGEVVDLSDMKRRGLLPKNSFQDSESSGEDRIVDLSSMRNSSKLNSSSSVSSSNSDSFGLGFLGSLAGANVGSSSSVSSTGSEELRYTERLKRARAGTLSVEHLKTKIEDLEYKMDRLIERLRKVEDKL